MVNIPRGRVIDVSTGAPVPSAQVMIYDARGKLHSTLTANAQGEFSTAFPAGEYGLAVHASQYSLANKISPFLLASADVVYDGGTFTVTRDNEPINMIVPVQTGVQKKESFLSLARELFQSIWFTVNKGMQKSDTQSGVVRDASTKTPLDLATVRLFDQETGRLVATRISDIYGRFSLFPSPGVYRVVATREGYEDSVQEHVAITDINKSALLAPVDLIRKGVL
ncbi:MAG: hypothetical protein A3E36_01790 [Candidatus Andersenbacteria bacterium RIFCSPHIGHO2_12_FULL_45_11b]|uniref:Carboxypeptidase regulatory-like domain-containing protein n=1 Tax=Candidatus Andersenbacteria bacterium RIFCSPHIGHO2_12_FULL_45_11b TaxID=1797282 RepID=A0A1G1X731_9BACT|nr:MAG: hypothetical protein A3E36_01790 [Candidatus Andersenbacteria bacterium RIFCSPHIGHO2_12_FULL_45_11b]